MNRYDELMDEMLSDFETYIQNHEDSGMLDLVDLQITRPQIDWFLSRLNERKMLPINRCATCQYYDFKEDSMQICLNTNNHQLNDDNPEHEERWYKMMVTPDFGCIEHKEEYSL